jgi:branched-chain amino acid transport system substrate-binding protein
VQAVVNWSIVPAQSIVAKNMKQMGLNVPLFQSHGFGNRKYVEQAGVAAEGTLFPAGRLLVVDELPDSNPQKKVLATYKRDYETMYKEDVSTFGGHAYDGLLVVTEALKKAGRPEREKVRDAIENLQARKAGHDEIRKHDIGTPFGNQIQTYLRVRCTQNFETGLCQSAGKEL